LTLIQFLVEHFDTSNDSLLRGLQTDDFDFFTDLNHTALNTASRNGTTTLNGQHVLDGHQEWRIGQTLGERNVGVDGFHQVVNRLFTQRSVFAFKSLEGRTANDGNFVTWKRGENG
jgi:hypothetical protein